MVLTIRRSSLLLIFGALALLSGCESLQIGLVATGRTVAPSAEGGALSASVIDVGNNDTVRLEAGTYRGTLVIDANNATVIGAGAARTLIDGDVVIDGNANELRGVTVTGSVRISGNTNSILGSDLSAARISVEGNNNRY